MQEIKFEAGTIMQMLHDGGINVGIQSFFDGDWSAWIGDPMNGYRIKAENFTSFAGCETWLINTALELYDDTDFSRNAKIVLNIV